MPASFAIQLFQIPAMVTMSIAATRIYRGLAEFAFGTTSMYVRYHFILFLFVLIMVHFAVARSHLTTSEQVVAWS